MLYGLKSKELQNFQTEEMECPKCQADSPFFIRYFQRHFHVFWIPLFPVGKPFSVYCMECEEELKKKELPTDFVQRVKGRKKELKTPWKRFLALPILGTLFFSLIGLGISQSNEDTVEEQKKIETPEIGDLYVRDVGSFVYQYFSIFKIEGDSVYFHPGRSEFTKVFPALNASNMRKEIWTTDTLILTKDQLRKELDADDVMDIKRIGEL